MDKPRVKLDGPHGNGKARLFQIPIEIMNLPSSQGCNYGDEDDGLDPTLTSDQVDTIRVHLEDEDFRYGDVIQLQCLGNYYREDGKYIWDGFDFQKAAHDIDAYGHLSSSFQVIINGYPSDYWSETISHNSIAWLDVGKLQSQLLKNYSSTNHGSGFITHFINNGVKYYLTNGIIKKSDGECYYNPHGSTLIDDNKPEPIGYFCFNVTEEFFLTTIRKGGITPIEVSEINSKILHFTKDIELTFEDGSTMTFQEWDGA